MSAALQPGLHQTARFGATVVGPGRTRFHLWAPAQRSVVLEIEGRDAVRMPSLEGGWFEVELAADPGTRYRYRIEHQGQAMTVPDPASRAQQGDVHGWSVVVDIGAYDWQARDWRGRPWEETVLYELHPGLLGGFRGIEAQLPALAALGITAIELMPVADFPGPRNWGYDGVLPYAPDEAYGTPADLCHLIDTAHGLGLMVFLDVVYNHFGPDGNYLGLTAPNFFRDDIHTPWGAAIDFRLPEVRAFFTGNAIHWINAYRFDGLRFDAVHAISEADWLDEMALAVRAAAGPDRHVHLVLEHDGNVASHLEPAPRRFDAQWNDDAHHVLHTLLTGEDNGYYRDYADRPAERLARVLSEGFAYQGEPSAHREGEPRGTPSAHLPPTAFVSFLQNHDQTGNRAFGDRLTALADDQALRAAVALLLLSPQIPLIYMGEEVGSRTPFLYFTSHNAELAALVREGRRNEFAGFAAFADPAQRERIPDPNDEVTFEASRPQDGPDAAGWRSLYTALLAVRREHLVPRLAGARSLGAAALGERAVVARWQLGDGSVLTLACNLGPLAVSLADAPDMAQLLFATDAPAGTSVASVASVALPGHCTRAFLAPAAGDAAP
jgi:maltooligosyltrehalose trehalohydrolase